MPISRVFHAIKHHKKRTIIVFIILIILFFFLRARNTQPKIATETVQEGTIAVTISANGTIHALKSADLTFQTAGKLVYLPVKKGDTVTKGETIASLDSRTVQKNLQNTLLDYADQRNAFDQTKQNNKDKPLTDDLNRILSTNQNDLQKAVNSVDLQSLAQEQSYLTTPIDGVVTRLDVTTPGITVTPTTVFEIIDPNSLVFDMDVDEADIGHVIESQEVKISLDAFPDETITLPIVSIDEVSHATSTGSTAYTAEVDLPSASIRKYRVGMQGDGEIITSEHHNAVYVTNTDITDKTYVYVQVPQGFVKRKITTGLQNDTQTEVLSGLTKGDIVATDPSTVPVNTKRTLF